MTVRRPEHDRDRYEQAKEGQPSLGKDSHPRARPSQIPDRSVGPTKPVGRQQNERHDQGYDRSDNAISSLIHMFG